MDHILLTVIALLSALGGLSGVGALYIAKSEKRKKQAEGAELMADAATQLITPYREDVIRYRKELEACYKRIAEKEREFRTLQRELDSKAQQILILLNEIKTLKLDVANKLIRITALEGELDMLSRALSKKKTDPLKTQGV